MAKPTNPLRVDLPSSWPQHVKSALLHVIALAQYAVAYTRSWAIDARIARIRLKAQNDQLRQEVALLTEETPLYEDPTNDPLISDDDNDGKPGVTVVVRLFGFIEGEIYIARREILPRTTLRSTPMAACSVLDH